MNSRKSSWTQTQGHDVKGVNYLATTSWQFAKDSSPEKHARNESTVSRKNNWNQATNIDSKQFKLKLNETIEQGNDRSINMAQNLFDKLYDLINNNCNDINTATETSFQFKMLISKNINCKWCITACATASDMTHTKCICICRLECNIINNFRNKINGIRWQWINIEYLMKQIQRQMANTTKRILKMNHCQTIITTHQNK